MGEGWLTSSVMKPGRPFQTMAKHRVQFEAIRSHHYHNINILKAVTVCLNNLKFPKCSPSRWTAIPGKRRSVSQDDTEQPVTLNGLNEKRPSVGETVRDNICTHTHKDKTVWTTGTLFLAPSLELELPPLV